MERELHTQESARLKSLDPVVDHVARAEADLERDLDKVLLRLLLHSAGTIREQLIDAEQILVHVAVLKQSHADKNKT